MKIYTFLAFKKWVKSIQTAGYNGARTVYQKKSLNLFTFPKITLKKVNSTDVPNRPDIRPSIYLHFYHILQVSSKYLYFCWSLTLAERGRWVKNLEFGNCREYFVNKLFWTPCNSLFHKLYLGWNNQIFQVNPFFFDLEITFYLH